MHLSAQKIIYVNQRTLGANNGESWEDAYQDLQSALREASYGDEIWVALGIYKPDSGSNRAISFVVPNGIKLYGGFVANERTLEERSNGYSILSGDVGEKKIVTDNSELILSLDRVDSTTIVDGFMIEYGYNLSNNIGIQGGSTAGLKVSSSQNPIIINCIIKNNFSHSGGGMVILESDAIVQNCIIENNFSNTWGGGIIVSDYDEGTRSKINLDNCVIQQNKALLGGDAIYIYAHGDININRCIITENYQSKRDINIYGFLGYLPGAIVYDGSVVPNNPIYPELNIVIKESLINNNFGAVTLFSNLFGKVNAVITNCTFVNNGTYPFIKAIDPWDINNNSSPFKIQNCIIWEEQDSSNIVFHDFAVIVDSNTTTFFPKQYDISYSLISTNLCEGCNEEVIYAQYPDFSNINDNDYRLSPCSPALNVGDNQVISSEVDLLGNSRIISDHVDLGAIEMPALSINNHKVDTACFETANANILFEIENGCPPFYYVWESINNTGTNLSNLAAGEYHFTVTDTKSSKNKGKIVIPQHEELMIYFTIQQPSFNDNSSGKIIIDSIEGGTPPYQVSIDGIPIGSSSDISVGGYQLLLVDANNCEKAIPLTIGDITDTKDFIPVDIQLYPNLILDNEYVTLYLPAHLSSLFQIKVVDSKGQLIETIYSDQKEINISIPQIKGAYFIFISHQGKIINDFVVVRN